VAEHSVRVAQILPAEEALWGLLHDAAEAYLVDLARPLKQLSGFSPYRETEAKVMAAICEHFGIPLEQPASVSRACIRAASARAAANPRRIGSERSPTRRASVAEARSSMLAPRW
jgi:hypothetical protein